MLPVLLQQPRLLLLPPLPPPLPPPLLPPPAAQAPPAAAPCRLQLPGITMKASPFTERAQELSPSSSAAPDRDVEAGHEDSGLLGQMSPRARAAAFRRTGSTTEVGWVG